MIPHPSIHLFSVLLLALLTSNAMIVFSDTNAQPHANGPSKESSDSTEKPLTLAIHLTDHSILIGTTSLESLAVKTAYANAQIPFAKIKSIQFNRGQKTFLVSLKNGDQLEATTELEEIPFLTSFGKISVAIKYVASIKSTADNAAPPNPAAGDLAPPTSSSPRGVTR